MTLPKAITWGRAEGLSSRCETIFRCFSFSSKSKVCRPLHHGRAQISRRRRRFTTAAAVCRRVARAPSRRGRRLPRPLVQVEGQLGPVRRVQPMVCEDLRRVRRRRRGARAAARAAATVGAGRVLRRVHGAARAVGGEVHLEVRTRLQRLRALPRCATGAAAAARSSTTAASIPTSARVAALAAAATGAIRAATIATASASVTAPACTAPAAVARARHAATSPAAASMAGRLPPARCARRRRETQVAVSAAAVVVVAVAVATAITVAAAPARGCRRLRRAVTRAPPPRRPLLLLSARPARDRRGTARRRRHRRRRRRRDLGARQRRWPRRCYRGAVRRTHRSG